jgi:hypothetical protein
MVPVLLAASKVIARFISSGETFGGVGFALVIAR